MKKEYLCRAQLIQTACLYNRVNKEACLGIDPENTSKPDPKDEAEKDKLRLVEEVAWLLAQEPDGPTAVSLEGISRHGEFVLRVARNTSLIDEERAHMARMFSGAFGETKDILLDILRLKRASVLQWCDEIKRAVESRDYGEMLSEGSANKLKEWTSLLRRWVLTSLTGPSDLDIADYFEYMHITKKRIQGKNKIGELAGRFIRCYEVAKFLSAFRKQYPNIKGLKLLSVRTSGILSNQRLDFGESIRRLLTDQQWHTLESHDELITEHLEEECDTAWKYCNVHPEMALLIFYDLIREKQRGRCPGWNHPAGKYGPMPFKNVIGTSEPSCFFCHRLLGVEYAHSGYNNLIDNTWTVPSFEFLAPEYELWWQSRITREMETLLMSICDRIDQIYQAEEEERWLVGDMNFNEQSQSEATQSTEPREEDVCTSVSSSIEDNLSQTTERVSFGQFTPPASSTTISDAGAQSTSGHTETGLPNLAEDPANLQNRYDCMIILFTDLSNPWKQEIISVRDISRDGVPSLGLFMSSASHCVPLPLPEEPLVCENMCCNPRLYRPLYEKCDKVILMENKILIRDDRQLGLAIEYFSNEGRMNIHAHLVSIDDLPKLVLCPLEQLRI